jgi:hypothetical protein
VLADYLGVDLSALLELDDFILKALTLAAGRPFFWSHPIMGRIVNHWLDPHAS